VEIAERVGRLVIFLRFGGHSRLAGHALLGLFGCDIPDGRVHAVTIIVSFDVSEQCLPRFDLGRPSTLMDEFDFQRVEEALHRCIVVTITRSAHRGRGADYRQVIDIGADRVLRPAIRVANETGRWSLPLRGHHQRGERQLGAHMVTHGPADDLSGRQVEHSSQIQPVFAGGDMRDVGEPDPVRRRRRKPIR